MTGKSIREGRITESSIKEAIGHARGDLFVTAGILRTTPREIDRWVRRSPELQAFAVAINAVKVSADYDKMSLEQYEDAVILMSAQYKIEAVETIAELMLAPHTDSAGAKVRLDAAIAMRGGPAVRKVEMEENSTMAELNALYLQNAPRIKEIRTVVTTFADERLVN